MGKYQLPYIYTARRSISNLSPSGLLHYLCDTRKWLTLKPDQGLATKLYLVSPLLLPQPRRDYVSSHTRHAFPWTAILAFVSREHNGRHWHPKSVSSFLSLSGAMPLCNSLYSAGARCVCTPLNCLNTSYRSLQAHIQTDEVNDANATGSKLNYLFVE